MEIKKKQNPFDELSAENKKLRDVLKSQTLELERNNRELEVEAALERVRAKSLEMQKSEELAGLSSELVKQVEALGVKTWFCAFNFYDDAEKGSLEWGSNSETVFPEYRTPREGIFLKYYEAGQRGETLFIYEIGEDACPAHYKYLCSLPGVGEQLLQMKDAGLSFPTSQIDHVAFHKYGYILFITFKSVPESHDIFIRFAKVFEQTYTRFLDLQKAEAQAREAQIEVAMERIRSRAIAMRSSDELLEVALEIRVQTDLLGQQDLELSVVHLYEKDAPYFESMAAMRVPGGEGEITTHKIKFPIDATPKIEQMMKNYWAGLSQYTITLDFQEREEWQQVLQATVPELYDKRLQFDQDAIATEKKEYWNFADFSGGSLLTVTYSPPTNETNELFRRAADVFDLAYKRYKDLQKAEEQTRKIELVNQENERLLHSILPKQIAHQIRTGQRNIVKRIEQASILFADIVGFTVLSEKAKPSEVVNILNGLFSNFDDLTDRYHLEKIKTIGDAYMVASGVPEENENHARTLFHFAQELLEVTKDYNQENNLQLQIRIGISSGPVVAGVIGKKKFSYDLWGDSVNTAARMEAYGQSGKIQVAPPSYELLKNDFAFDKISGMDIKGKGIMDVYLWKPNQ